MSYFILPSNPFEQQLSENVTQGQMLTGSHFAQGTTGGQERGRQEDRKRQKRESRIQNEKKKKTQEMRSQKNNFKLSNSSRGKGFHIGTLCTSLALAYSLGAVKHNRCFSLTGKRNC